MFLLQGMGMILANLLAISIIVLVAWLFLRRGPVTESKLRRMVKADSIPARDVCRAAVIWARRVRFYVRSIWVVSRVTSSVR